MLKRMSLYEKAVWLMLLLYFWLTYAIYGLVGKEGSRLGGVMMLLPVAAALLFYLIHSGGVVRFRFNAFFFYMLFFGLYCMVNSLWAYNAGVAFSRGEQMLEKLIVMAVFFLCFQDLEHSTEDILLALMWGGFLFCAYYILYVGPSHVLSSVLGGKRSDSTVLNVNSLGMCAAYALMLYVHFLLTGKARLRCLPFAALCFVCILASQSRKGLIAVAFGVVGIFFFHTVENKNARRTLIKVLALLLALLLLCFLLSRWSVLAGYLDRFRTMLSGLSGGEEMDKSTWERLELRNLGKTLFLQNPIGGVGIDSPRNFSVEAVGREDMYLHDNYIELLAGGGLIGFLLYYWLYAVLLVKLLRRRKARDPEWAVCFLLLILMLLMDYGAVSYHERSTYFYLMPVFLYCENLRRSA